jgi:cyclohexanecarboxylate-CoA ligase
MKPTWWPRAEVVEDYRGHGWWSGEALRDPLPRRAEATPDRAAVISARGHLTFADLDEQAAVVASALHARGVTAEDVVSFQLPNWPEAVVLFQGIAKLGAVANPIVPIYRGHELRHILGQAGTTIVVVPGEFRGVDYPAMYRELRADLPGLREVVIVDATTGSLDGETSWADFLASGRASPPPDVAVAPEQVALLLYTSGTTAAAKGALHSSDTLLYDARSVREWFDLGGDDVVFNPSPVTHVTGVLMALILPSLVGCPVVLQDVWDADAAWGLIVEHRVTFMAFATPFLAGLLDSPERPDPAATAVRYVICGGADMPSALLVHATHAIGPTVRMYGATECQSTTCTDVSDPLEARTTTDGRWMTPTEGRIVDSEGHRVGAGVEGEVVWRGPDMFLGYLDSSLNDAVFTEDGWFRTGDLAVQDGAGYLRITGRSKDIINRAGEKFSAREIEDLLYAHPAVSDVAVVARPDPVTVERACAFVVPAPGAAIDLAEVGRFLAAAQVSRRKVPEELILVDELPRTASGKIQKHLLRASTQPGERR